MMAGNTVLDTTPAQRPVSLRAKSQRSPWRDAARRFARNRLAMLGLVVIL
ncbi:MAG: ABC transporter permease, partial [Anaerolineae bacterium]|nr:ABC transporter permease [Anaerolineae bacterium]